MAQTRFTCSLTRADEPTCRSYARVTIVDSEGATARGCLVTLSPCSTASPALMLTGPIPRASTSGSARHLSCPGNGAGSQLRGDEDQGVMVPVRWEPCG
jgi:hypothetical protein